MLLSVEMSPRMVQKSPNGTQNKFRNLAGFFCLGQAVGLENYFGASHIEGSANILWATLSSVGWDHQQDADGGLLWARQQVRLGVPRARDLKDDSYCVCTQAAHPELLSRLEISSSSTPLH